MMKSSKFRLPCVTKNEKGNIRKVGFEMEFSGLHLPEAAKIVAGIFGGRIKSESPFTFWVIDSIYGDFKVELDAAILKDQRYKEYLNKIGIDLDQLKIGEDIEMTLSRLAEAIVPHEIVLPPIPMDQMDIVEDLREQLSSKNAKGTKASFFYAFSLQINPEAPSLGVDLILNYLRAFLLLYHWIFKQSEIDLTRRMAPFINEFPLSYSRRVLAPDYSPNINELIDHYLEQNPTRNRPLDLLPLFCFLDRKRVFLHNVEKELIKERPAFHYRLPNCLIDDPAWSVAREWNLWVEIENLADEPDRIQRMALDFLSTVDSPLAALANRWVEKVPRWIGGKRR